MAPSPGYKALGYNHFDETKRSRISISLKQKPSPDHHVYTLLRPTGKEIDLHVVTKKGSSLDELINVPTFGCVSPGDFRLDSDCKQRAVNISESVAMHYANNVHLPDGMPVKAVYADNVVLDEATAGDIYAAMRALDVNAVSMQHDAWTMIRATTIDGLLRLAGRDDMPVLDIGGNNPGKPGVVGDKATNGAFSQYGLAHHVIGNIDETGLNPAYEKDVIRDITNWAYAAMTKVAIRGERILNIGKASGSMDMETGMSHILATRKTFGLEFVGWDTNVFYGYVAELMDAAKSNSRDHPYAQRLNEMTTALLAMTNPNGSKKG